MKKINTSSGLTTAGATGIVLMVLHILGYITGWAWPIFYTFLILIGIGLENSSVEKNFYEEKKDKNI